MTRSYEEKKKRTAARWHAAPVTADWQHHRRTYVRRAPALQHLSNGRSYSFATHGYTCKRRLERILAIPGKQRRYAVQTRIYRLPGMLLGPAFFWQHFLSVL